MAQDMQFMRESPFWYFLARRDLECSAESLARVLKSLQHRAAELSLPIHYPWEHASAWAVLLQLFEVAGPYREVAGRFGYEMMLAGFDRVFRPKGFSKEVLSRLLGNLRSPAFPRWVGLLGIPLRPGSSEDVNCWFSTGLCASREFSSTKPNTHNG